MVSVYVVVALSFMTHICCFHFMSCSAHLNHAWNQPLKLLYILVSQFSAIQGEDTAEETPAYQLQKEASVYSETNCKETVSCAGRLALQKETAICIAAAIVSQ